MKKYTLNWYCLIILCLIGSFFSCSKFVDIEDPTTKIGAETVFSSDATAESSVIGLYGRMMTSNFTLFNGATTIYAGLSADEFSRTVADATLDVFTNNAIDSKSDGLALLWTNGYNYIYHANACIDGINKSTAISASKKAQLLAEAKFLRGLTYFYLVNFFEALPLITETDYRKNSLKPQSSKSAIYAQIIEDLKQAKLNLSINYAGADKVRANKWAASALLARVYLYTGDWSAAETESSGIIASGAYSLPSDLNAVFLKASGETIWQLAPVSTSLNTSEGNEFIPATSASSRAKFGLSTSLLSDFEANDKRKVSWTATKTVSNIANVYPVKYKTKTGIAPYVEMNVMLRLAEQYLIRAEARAELNNVSDGRTDLNTIRLRAGLTSSIAADKAALLLAIEKERRSEFFAELGHRWFDLKRTNRIDAILGPLKGSNWQSSDALYPIPYAQIIYNPTLKQNPGYTP